MLSEIDLVRRVPSTPRPQADSDVNAVKRSLPKTEHPDPGKKHGQAVRREHHVGTSDKAQTMAVVGPNGYIRDDGLMSKSHISLGSKQRLSDFSSSTLFSLPVEVQDFAGRDLGVHLALEDGPFQLHASTMLTRPSSYDVNATQLLMFVIGALLGVYLAHVGAAFLKRRGMPGFREIFNSWIFYFQQHDAPQNDQEVPWNANYQPSDTSKSTKGEHQKTNRTARIAHANKSGATDPKHKHSKERKGSDGSDSEHWSESEEPGSQDTVSEPEPLIDANDGFGQLLQGGFLWKLRQCAAEAITSQLIGPQSDVEITDSKLEYPDESKDILNWNLRRFELQAGSDALKLMYVSERADMSVQVMTVDINEGGVEQLASLRLSVCDEVERKRFSVAAYKISVQNKHELVADAVVPSVLHTFTVTGVDESGKTLRSVLGATSDNLRAKWISAITVQSAAFRAARAPQDKNRNPSKLTMRICKSSTSNRGSHTSVTSAPLSPRSQRSPRSTAEAALRQGSKGVRKNDLSVPDDSAVSCPLGSTQRTLGFFGMDTENADSTGRRVST